MEQTGWWQTTASENDLQPFLNIFFLHKVLSPWCSKDTSFSLHVHLTSFDLFSLTASQPACLSVLIQLLIWWLRWLSWLFWLSLSALPACYDPQLGWLGSMWACVQACVCTGIFSCVYICVGECISCVLVCAACTCLSVCACTLFMCVGVCMGRALQLTVNRQPEDILMRFLTVDANQWILTWCSLSTLSCKTHRGNIFKFSFSSV